MIRTLRAHQSSCVPEAYTVQLQSVHPRIAHLGLWTLRQPIAHREKLRQTARSPGHGNQLQTLAATGRANTPYAPQNSSCTGWIFPGPFSHSSRRLSVWILQRAVHSRPNT